METIDKAIDILHATNDGNDLAPKHLSLVEGAVNGWLTDAGKEAFENLYQQVEKGYIKPWHCGVENLTKDLQGFIYWKGIEVEHFSIRDYDKEKAAAEELGVRCRHLESIGVEVSCRNVIYHWDKCVPSVVA